MVLCPFVFKNDRVKDDLLDFLDDACNASLFDIESYSDLQQINVLCKLNLLKLRLINCDDLDAKRSIDECIKYVSSGYSLTEKVIDYLNYIHSKYDNGT